MSDLILKSDLEAKKLIRYSDQKIGDLIDKSRQAVNKGLKSTHYFSRTDWIAIVNDLVAVDHPKLPEILAYLESRNISVDGSRSTSAIQPVNLMALTLDSVEAVIPNAQDFRQYYPACFKAFIGTLVKAKAPSNNLGRNEVYLGAQAGAFLISREMKQAAIEADTVVKQTPNAFKLSDPSQYAVLFRLRSRDSGGEPIERYLTCISDRFVELDAPMIEQVFDSAQANALLDDRVTIAAGEAMDA